MTLHPLAVEILAPTGNARREAILEAIRAAPERRTVADLAEEFGVTERVVRCLARMVTDGLLVRRPAPRRYERVRGVAG